MHARRTAFHSAVSTGGDQGLGEREAYRFAVWMGQATLL